MSIQLFIKDHLLIPFGKPKWDIAKIRLAGVSSDGTYIASDTPCAYIDRKAARPLTLGDFPRLFPQDFGLHDQDASTVVGWFKAYMLQRCDFDTENEKKFLDLYFQWCSEEVSLRRSLAEGGYVLSADEWKDENLIFRALAPLPQAHLYCRDPLTEYTFVPERMHKVDFGFWDGRELIAVEIDGGSHIGSSGHVTKDRVLQRAGVRVVHILNNELEEHGTRAISRLLPESVVRFVFNDAPVANPLAFPF